VESLGKICELDLDKVLPKHIVQGILTRCSPTTVPKMLSHNLYFLKA